MNDINMLNYGQNNMMVFMEDNNPIMNDLIEEETKQTIHDLQELQENELLQPVIQVPNSLSCFICKGKLIIFNIKLRFLYKSCTNQMLQ